VSVAFANIVVDGATMMMMAVLVVVVVVHRLVS
jgi:hypothetical protein